MLVGDTTLLYFIDHPDPENSFTVTVVPINEVGAGQPLNSEPFLFPLPGKHKEYDIVFCFFLLIACRSQGMIVGKQFVYACSFLVSTLCLLQ